MNCGLYSQIHGRTLGASDREAGSVQKAWSGKRGAQDPDPFIEGAVWKAEPPNAAITSRKHLVTLLLWETYEDK